MSKQPLLDFYWKENFVYWVDKKGAQRKILLRYLVRDGRMLSEFG